MRFYVPEVWRTLVQCRLWSSKPGSPRTTATASTPTACGASTCRISACVSGLPRSLRCSASGSASRRASPPPPPPRVRTRANGTTAPGRGGRPCLGPRGEVPRLHLHLGELLRQRDLIVPAVHDPPRIGVALDERHCARYRGTGEARGRTLKVVFVSTLEGERVLPNPSATSIHCASEIG